jgi:hypothetical protein
MRKHLLFSLAATAASRAAATCSCIPKSLTLKANEFSNKCGFSVTDGVRDKHCYIREQATLVGSDQPESVDSITLMELDTQLVRQGVPYHCDNCISISADLSLAATQVGGIQVATVGKNSENEIVTQDFIFTFGDGCGEPLVKGNMLGWFSVVSFTKKSLKAIGHFRH